MDKLGQAFNELQGNIASLRRSILIIIATTLLAAGFILGVLVGLILGG